MSPSLPSNMSPSRHGNIPIRGDMSPGTVIHPVTSPRKNVRGSFMHRPTPSPHKPPPLSPSAKVMPTILFTSTYSVAMHGGRGAHLVWVALLRNTSSVGHSTSVKPVTRNTVEDRLHVCTCVSFLTSFHMYMHVCCTCTKLQLTTQPNNHCTWSELKHVLWSHCTVQTVLSL